MFSSREPHLPEVVPQTMTNHGLQFLEALARQNRSGCFVEVGPLFGSSTIAIHKGRRTSDPIYSIDTFAPAQWVVDRFGFDLSREAYDKYTSHIPNLKVVQGFAPDVVVDTWTDEIGFYFDDATHGNPGWMNNYNFFSKFFTDDVIICGDDFAAGWPAIVRNVNQICGENGARNYVIGRVFAFAFKNEQRIIDAVDEVFPKLQGIDIETFHDGRMKNPVTSPAAVWSDGLHLPTPLNMFRFTGRKLPQEAKLKIERRGEHESKPRFDQCNLSQSDIKLRGAQSISLDFPDGLGIQFCLCEPDKFKCMNTKIIKAREELSLQDGKFIVSVRLHTL